MQKESLGKYISGIYRTSQSIKNKRFEDYEIGSGQHDFLYVICNNEGISQKELSDRLHVGKGTTAKAVKNLEKSGYIRRERGLEDKRFYRLYLTDKGKELSPLINSTFKEMIDIYAEGFSEEEYNSVLNSLKKILVNIHNSRDALDFDK